MSTTEATQNNLPSALAAVLESASGRFVPQWYRYFWLQNKGYVPVVCAPLNAPAKPTSGWLIYFDVADGKLKAIASSGTIVVLGAP